MEFIKINFLVTIIVLSLCSWTNTTVLKDCQEYLGVIEENCSLSCSESIVMEDDIMFITANDPVSEISMHFFKDNSVTIIQGCNLLKCNIDLSNYTEGGYDVYVTTTTGGFPGDVSVVH